MFLQPKGALAFGMVVHELATNAVKYGALSVPFGKVAVRWEIIADDMGDALRWQWQETDGPAVLTPNRRGFGVSMIERSLTHEMNGKAEIDSIPGGVAARLMIPFSDQVMTRDSFVAGRPA